MSAGHVARVETLVRRVVVLATALMLALSWPLWVGSGDDFPRVPFLAGWPQTTGAVAWLAFGALEAALVGMSAFRFWKPWYWASVGLLVLLVGQDQHRFQPWVYQYVMTVLFLAALPQGEGLRYARWWFVALYLHSGLSKLDRSFCDELGPVFLRAATGPWGIDPAQWRPPVRMAAVLAMPVGEIGLAWMLAVPRWRTLGRLGAVGLHVTLIGLLGPWRLGHSAIVLVWNAAMLVEVWLTFVPHESGDGSADSGKRSGERGTTPHTQALSRTGREKPDFALPRGFWFAHPVRETDRSEPALTTGKVWRVWPVVAIFWAGVLLPLGERWGVWDAWPSHALYASHVARVDVLVHESVAEGLPTVLSDHLKRVGTGGWARLDLTGWSRSVRGTPVYPQNRACLGLAEALAARYRGPLAWRVVAIGPGNRWSGSRRREQADGRDQIHTLGDRSWWNAHPWPGNRGAR